MPITRAYKTSGILGGATTNGETLVADSSTSTGLRYQTGVNTNSIINGGFDIWQRGTSFTGSLGNVYGADRWMFNVTTARTYSRQSASLDGFQYSLRMQRNNGSTDTGGLYAIYSMESADSYRLAGKTVTLSFYAKAGANYSSSGSSLGLSWFSGTGTDQNVYTVGYTGAVLLSSTTPTITTSWARYSVTATLGSSVSETGFYFYYTPTGTAGANDWVEITGVQMELGSVATQFKRAGGTLAGELAACQRYYFRSQDRGQFGSYTDGYAQSSTIGWFTVPLPVTMRIKPSSIDWSTIRILRHGVAGYDVTTLNLDANSSTNQAGVLQAIVASGLGTGEGYTLGNAGSTAGYIGFSAEL